MNIGGAHITTGESWVCTRYGDGSQVDAHPSWSHEDYARAAALGYGEGDAAVAAMTRDHDVLHSLLAVARGQHVSPTLWAVAHGQSVPHDVGDDEERIVLLLQRVSQLGLNGILRADYVHNDDESV